MGHNPVERYVSDATRLTHLFAQATAALCNMKAMRWWWIPYKLWRHVPLFRCIVPDLTGSDALGQRNREFNQRRDDCLKMVQENVASPQDLAVATSDLAAMVGDVIDDVFRISSHWWWRVGVGLRALTGAFGLKSRSYYRADFAVAHTASQLERWKRENDLGEPLDHNLRDEPHTKVQWAAPQGAVFYAEFAKIEVEDRLFQEAWRLSEAIIGTFDGPPPTYRPLISIILPTYNREDVVATAIQSVLEQTWSNWELLICDDGSVDGTRGVCSSFQDPRIFVYSFEHRGAAAARNSGLERAKGEWIAYIDSDNIWHPCYLHAVISSLHNQPIYSAAFAHRIVVEESDDRRMSLKSFDRPSYSFDDLELENFVDLNAFMHRKCLVTMYGGFDPDLRNCQDWDLALRYCFHQTPLRVDAYLCLYRKAARLGQISQNHIWRWHSV